MPAWVARNWQMSPFPGLELLFVCLFHGTGSTQDALDFVVYIRAELTYGSQDVIIRLLTDSLVLCVVRLGNGSRCGKHVIVGLHTYTHTQKGS